MSDESRLFAARILTAQAAYQSAIARYRREPTEPNRLALEAAQKALDDVHRLAVTEVASVSTARH